MCVRACVPECVCVRACVCVCVCACVCVCTVFHLCEPRIRSILKTVTTIPNVAQETKNST